MKRIVLTGSTGYFGSLAKKYLEDDGYELLTAGRHQGADIHFDLNKPEDFANTVFENIDAFIHAAAVNEVECVKHPYGAVYKNVASTRAVLDFCVKNRIKKFIYISTFHVYGKDSGHIDEQTKAEPLHDYGLTHLQAEEYVKLYTRKGLVEGVSLRPSNMFDVPVDLMTFNRWSLIPFGFCKDAVEKGCIELKSPGYQQRNFVSVFDIVKTIEAVLEYKFHGDVLNIAGEDTVSIREFASMVAKVAAKVLERDVRLIFPNADGETPCLSYKSISINPQEAGFRHIENYIVDFIKVLSR